MPTPEFVLSIREKIGHDLLWMTGVTAVILDDRERILLCRRADNGAWTPITGIVDPGEQPADTAVREAEEETGVRIAVEGLASVLSNPPLVFPNGDRAQYIDHTFACTYLGGEPHPADGENTDARWFAIDDLPDMSPHMLARIEAGLADEVSRLGAERVDYRGGLEDEDAPAAPLPGFIAAIAAAARDRDRAWSRA